MRERKTLVGSGHVAPEQINSEGGVPLSHNFVSRSRNDHECPQGQDLQL